MDIAAAAYCAKRVQEETTEPIANLHALPDTVRAAPPEIRTPEIKTQSEITEVAVIDNRVLLRECFARSIEAEGDGISVTCFSTIAEWQSAASGRSASLILLCCCSGRLAQIQGDIDTLTDRGSGIPVIVVADEANAEEIVRTIHLGARGFIPASLNLRLAVLAMQLVRGGGVYLPENLLGASRAAQLENEPLEKLRGSGLFTERQAAVLEALRQGKPNKIIAYELDMRESTVKVHVRSVMKKLRARNRTEVAFITNKLIALSG